MEYIIHFNIAALFVTVFITVFLFFKKDRSKPSNKILLALFISHFLAVIFGIGSPITNNNIHLYSFGFRDLWNYGFLVSHNTTAFLFTLYVIYFLGVHHKKAKKYFLFTSIPFMVSMAIFIMNPFLNWLFYYNDAKIYTHGPMMKVLYFNAYIYMLYATVLVIRSRKRLVPRFKYFSLLVFLACSVFPIVIQMFYPHLLIELFFQSLGLLGILLAVENEDEILDGITKVYNRYAFIMDANAAILGKIPSDLLVVKLSGTSYYNTTLGIDFMNGIMADMADWLKRLDPSISVYDCGKGNFCLMDFGGSYKIVLGLAKATLERFSQKWVYKKAEITIPCQISTFSVPRDISNLEQVMLIIDAPFEGQDNNSGIIFSGAHNYYQRKIDVEHAIEKAMKDRSFRVFYQPIWNRRKNRVDSAEALLRLFDSDLGNIPPDEFIPIAEKNGSIIEIGEFVFAEVCRLISENNMDRLGIVSIDVNLSIVQCMYRGLANSFANILKGYGVNPAMINLEITESVTSSNEFIFLKTMTELRKIGFTFSLDDYGTGYSNLSYIINTPFQIVKLDKSLLWSAGKNERSRIVLQNTIKMLQEMRLKVVVEGVETKEQKKFLEDQKCDYMQGYFFSRPLEETSFLTYCQEHKNEKIQGTAKSN